MAETANQIFLPWVQPGIAAHIPDSAIDRLNTDQPAVVSLLVKLGVNADTLTKTVRLFGPGHVTGIDPQQVVRVEPRPQTTDFEPNYFPAIEFDRPDFPWLFTPAKGGAQGRLRPWLCLVVVRKQQGVELRPAAELPQPVLVIQSPARPVVELPDLSESHLWAHAQITGTEKSQIKAAIATDPARSLSRLLCPRRLEPTTEYIACVVPTFEVGRKAGLNLSILPAEEQQLQPAWLSGPQAPLEITLPVYYSWEFRTGSGGDFEALARRLEPHELPPEVGKRPMDISHPGFKMQPMPQPGAPGTILGLEGALRVVGREPDAWPDPVRLMFQTELAKILNSPWENATQNSAGKDAIAAPPIYGRWQAAMHRVGTRLAPLPPAWLDELNLDPRYRAAAALGTRVIQSQQESLMTSAWEQHGEIQTVNQRLRQAQLSRAVNTSYYQSFSQFSAETFLQIVAPAQSRLWVRSRSPNPQSSPQPNPPAVQTRLVQMMTASIGSASAVSAPLRRLSRPRGPINKPYIQAGTEGIGSLVALFNQPPNQNVRQPSATGEITWVDDTIPAGAIVAGDGEGWNWISAASTPYNGTRIHRSNAIAGLHQHFFYNATDTIEIISGDKLFAYIWLDFDTVPNQIMLQWHAEGNWGHRAYWRLLGNDELGWGLEGTVSRRRIAGFPIVGGWVRLEVPAAAVGLEGKTLTGMAFTLVGGAASWGRAGKVSRVNRGAVTIDQVSDQFPMGGSYIWVEDPVPHWERVRAVDVQMHNTFRFNTLANLSALQPAPATSTEFYQAAKAHQAYLQQAFIVPIIPSRRAAMNMADVKNAALPSLDPNQTIQASVLANFTTATTTAMTRLQLQTGDPLEPIMDAPTFPQAMSEALRELSQDYLFPGLEHVPPNTVQILQTNPQFIEAFMVGLNAEMSRELLWRGYPTDQRGTYFRHFWDTLATAATNASDATADIQPIHTWGDRHLGENAIATNPNKLVLLIRGELLRRYPNTVIYAVKAVPKGATTDLSTDPAQALQPRFRGTLEPDVTFVGFDLTPAEMVAGLGWYIVLQQQPTEPRFGLDNAIFSADGSSATPALTTWNDLSWAHLAANAPALQQLSHAAVKPIQLQPTTPKVKGIWGHNAAHMAYITKQQPMRVAIHATELIR